MLMMIIAKGAMNIIDVLAILPYFVDQLMAASASSSVTNPGEGDLEQADM